MCKITRKILELTVVYCSMISAVLAQSVSLSGSISVVVEEFENGGELESYVLQPRNGKACHLRSNGHELEGLSPGDFVSVVGDFIEDSRFPNSFLVEKVFKAAYSGEDDSFYNAFGPKKLMVIRGKFSDNPERCTREEIANVIWDGEDNVNKYFQIVSDGDISFPPDSDGDNQHDIFDVDFGIPTPSTCNSLSLSIMAEQILAEQGVNWDFYDHRMLILPQGMPCSYFGAASTNCTDGRCDVWIKTTCDIHGMGVIAHEIGHNIGFKHSGVDLNNDYQVEDYTGEWSCLMGPAQLVHPNAVHKAQVGWVSKDRQQLLAGDGIYSVAALEQTADQLSLLPSGTPQLLRIADIDAPYSQSPYLNYCISFRTPNGKYSDLINNVDRNAVHVHRCIFSNDRWNPVTTFLGTSYFLDEVPIKWDSGHGISVKIVESQENYATVEVRFDDFDEPTPTVTPVASSSSSPATSSSPAPSDSIRPSESLEPNPTLESGQPGVSNTPVPVPSTSIPVRARIVLKSVERAGKMVVKGKLLISGKSAATEEIAIYQIEKGLGNLTALATTSPSDVIQTDRKGRFRYVIKRSKTKLRFRFADTWSKSVRFKRAKN